MYGDRMQFPLLEWDQSTRINESRNLLRHVRV